MLNCGLLHLRRTIGVYHRQTFAFICPFGPSRQIRAGNFCFGLERLTRNGLSVGSSIPRGTIGTRSYYRNDTASASCGDGWPGVRFSIALSRKVLSNRCTARRLVCTFFFLSAHNGPESLIDFTVSPIRTGSFRFWLGTTHLRMVCCVFQSVRPQW